MEKWQLEQRQAQPLAIKEKMTMARIRDWYLSNNGEVYVAFSGGKDSTVLLHLARRVFDDIPAVFSDTGLEYPEIRKFVKSVDNCITIRPKLSFREVITKYGYLVISKEVSQKVREANSDSVDIRNKRRYGKLSRNGKLCGKLPEKWMFLLDAPFKISNQCCMKLKHGPFFQYERESGRKPITGIMASDSALRKTSLLKTGCNNYNSSRPVSNPMLFWNESDIWEYIGKYNISYSKIYDMGYSRTGCMFCLAGITREKDSKFDRMYHTHPSQWNYCMKDLGLYNIIEYIEKGIGKKLIKERL